MQLERIKWVVSAAWVVTAAILGVFVRDVTWQLSALFVALAVLPPLALLFWWTDPPETLSEAINAARGKTWPS